MRLLKSLIAILFLCLPIGSFEPIANAGFGYSNLPVIPSYATAFGITKLNRYFAFSDNSSLDLAETNGSGFAWYITNPPNYPLSTCGGSPCPANNPAWFTNPSNNKTLVITNNAANGQGAQTMAFGWISTGVVVGQSTWPGSAGFYFEALAQVSYTVDQCSVAGLTPDLWIQDRPGTIAQIQGSGSFRFGEIDVFEACVNLDGYSYLMAQTIVDWGTWNTNSYTRNGYQLSPSPNFRRYGVLMVPMSANGGTGFVQWYVDGVATGSPISWTASNQFGAILENGNFEINFAAGVNIPLSIKSIYVATP